MAGNGGVMFVWRLMSISSYSETDGVMKVRDNVVIMASAGMYGIS